MPETVTEAERVWRHYDGLNGRYYLKADVVIEEKLYIDVIFDGDSLIAAEHDRHPLPAQPQLIGKQVLAYLVTRDRTGGQSFGEANDEQRQLFLDEHGRQA